MGQQAARREEGTSRKKRQGIVGALFYFFVLIGWLSVISWFFLGVYFGLCQMVQGQDRINEQINNMIEMNTTLLSSEDHFWLGNAYTAFEAGEKKIVYAALIKTHLSDGWQWLDEKIRQGNELVQQKSPGWKDKEAGIWYRIFYPLTQVFLGCAIVIGMRLFIFLLSLPLFILWVVLGIVDGLVQRDIRKFQGARESTYFFHRIKKAWHSSFFVPLFLYLVWPYAINPAWFLVPMAVGLGLMMQLSLRSFKKYV